MSRTSGGCKSNFIYWEGMMKELFHTGEFFLIEIFFQILAVDKEF